MLKIFIQGIKEGKHEVDLSVPAESIDGISSEFSGEVEVKGILTSYRNRFSLTVNVSCSADLICDLSLKEYREQISFVYSASFIYDDEKYFEQKERELNDNEEIAILSDSKYIDITGELLQELIVHLPMKRISPEFRDKSFEDIYPDIANGTKRESDDSEIDERWSKLKNIKLN